MDREDVTPRRAILRSIVSTVIAVQLAACGSDALAQAQQPAFADPNSADEWMQRWITETRLKDPSLSKAPNGVLHVGRFADPVYYLTSVIGWDPNPREANAFPSVRVPIGFVTDFASIPRVFWSLLRPDGLYSYAAVIHDYLYWEQFLSREDSDSIFKLCMEDFQIDPATIATVYSGVRVGGGLAWESIAKQKGGGERRVLRRTPNDPAIRWADWKVRPDVY